jgi:hypothetical protein
MGFLSQAKKHKDLSSSFVLTSHSECRREQEHHAPLPLASSSSSLGHCATVALTTLGMASAKLQWSLERRRGGVKVKAQGEAEEETDLW